MLLVNDYTSNTCLGSTSHNFKHCRETAMQHWCGDRHISTGGILNLAFLAAKMAVNFSPCESALLIQAVLSELEESNPVLLVQRKLFLLIIFPFPDHHILRASWGGGGGERMGVQLWNFLLQSKV